MKNLQVGGMEKEHKVQCGVDKKQKEVWGIEITKQSFAKKFYVRDRCFLTVESPKNWLFSNLPDF